ncbi:MAG: DUF3343 domain-containing protein [Tissierellia bacterium]|nr:DUF3343 domain-containing protein [Tissierellia bacterium]
MKCIVTFHTIADAMHMEALCGEAKIPGRLIPVPRELSSGCGISWASEVDQEDNLKTLIEREDFDIESMVLL